MVASHHSLIPSQKGVVIAPGTNCRGSGRNLRYMNQKTHSAKMLCVTSRSCSPSGSEAQNLRTLFSRLRILGGKIFFNQFRQRVGWRHDLPGRQLTMPPWAALAQHGREEIVNE